MLERELAGKEKDWLLAHGEIRSWVVRKWEETEKCKGGQHTTCKGGQHTTCKNIVALR